LNINAFSGKQFGGVLQMEIVRGARLVVVLLDMC
jgi:hypothetical protein